MAGTATLADITRELADEITAAAVRKAQELDLLMNVAVIDVGGNLKTFTRMDGAWLGSIDVSIKKARTARFFDMGSGDLGPMVQPGQPLYHIEFSNDGLITFPGGLPLVQGGQTVGAIGVSGSTVDNDLAVAQAGAAAFSSAVSQ